MSSTIAVGTELSTLSPAGRVLDASNSTSVTHAEQVGTESSMDSDTQSERRDGEAEGENACESQADVVPDVDDSSEPSDDITSGRISSVRKCAKAALDFLAKEWLANTIAVIVVIFTIIMWRLAQWTARNDAIQSCGTLYAIGFSSEYCNKSMAAGVTEPPILKRQNYKSAAISSWSSWSHRPIAFTAAVVLTVAAGLLGLIYVLPRREPFRPMVSLACIPLPAKVYPGFSKVLRPGKASIQTGCHQGDSNLGDLSNFVSYDAWDDDVVHNESNLKDPDLKSLGHYLGVSYYSSDDESSDEHSLHATDLSPEEDKDEHFIPRTLDSEKKRDDGPWLSAEERDAIFDQYHVSDRRSWDACVFSRPKQATPREAREREAGVRYELPPPYKTRRRPLMETDARMSDPNHPAHWAHRG